MPFGDPGNPAPPVGVAPATGYGDTKVGAVLGPGQFNWDISLLKNTKITERINMQFRADMYNAFNHAQFADPGGASFGTIGFEDIATPSTVQIIHTNVNPRLDSVRVALHVLSGKPAANLPRLKRNVAGAGLERSIQPGASRQRMYHP